MENISASEIFAFLFTGISSVVGWFEDLILVGDWSLVIYGTIFMCVFYRLILKPLFGGFGVSSDPVKGSLSKEGLDNRKVIEVKKSSKGG